MRRRKQKPAETEASAMASADAVISDLRTVIFEGWKVQQRVAAKAGLPSQMPDPRGDNDERR